jgi:Fe2+ transport system protein FeoA
MEKELLFKPRLKEEDYEIPGVGTIRIRALSRDEAYAVQSVKATEAQERKILSFGMVDPTITETEVFKWQQASPAGEIEGISTRISQMSGLSPEADKESYKSFRDESESGVRVLPGAEAGDDSGQAPSGNEQ